MAQASLLSDSFAHGREVISIIIRGSHDRGPDEDKREGRNLEGKGATVTDDKAPGLTIWGWHTGTAAPGDQCGVNASAELGEW